MVFAILILIAAGIYVCVKGEVQASGSLIIKGQPTLLIGCALVAGAVCAVALPALFAMVGIFDDVISGLYFSFAILAATLGYIAFVALAERKKILKAKSEAQMATQKMPNQSSQPTPSGRG